MRDRNPIHKGARAAEWTAIPSKPPGCCSTILPTRRCGTVSRPCHCCRPKVSRSPREEETFGRSRGTVRRPCPNECAPTSIPLLGPFEREQVVLAALLGLEGLGRLATHRGVADAEVVALDFDDALGLGP